MQNTPYNNNQGYYPPPGYNQQPYIPPQPPQPPQPPKAPGDGAAIASMVLGIISDAILVFSCFTGFFISIICSVVGLILGIISYKKRPSNSGLAGLITNIIALAISVIVAIIFIIAIFSASYYYPYSWWW